MSFPSPRLSYKSVSNILCRRSGGMGRGSHGQHRKRSVPLAAPPALGLANIGATLGPESATGLEPVGRQTGFHRHSQCTYNSDDFIAGDVSVAAESGDVYDSRVAFVSECGT